MASEKRRKCGFRKLGGLYLVGEGLSVPCDRLPIKLDFCRVCGNGFKPSLGFTWIQPKELFGEHLVTIGMQENAPRDACGEKDPLCKNVPDRSGLMWVGSRFYTCETFIDEAREMGVCKRIAAVPNDFVLGETWVLLGHRGAYYDGFKHSPGIFYAFRPKAVEKLVASDTAEEELEKLRKRGITPILVDKNDKDHQGTVYQDVKAEREPKKQREPNKFLDDELGPEIPAEVI